MTSVDPPPADPLRLRLYRGREAAHLAACRCRNLDAGHISYIASQFAAAWTFRREADDGQLRAAIRILTWLFLAARALERLEAGDGQ